MTLKRKLIEKFMPKEFGAISGLFHVGIFSMQSKIIQTLGDIGFKDYIFPSIKESIENLENIGLKTIKGESLEDFGKRFIELLKKSLLVKDAKFKRVSENEYLFTLDNCFMAKTAHEVAGIEGLCPMAMVMASIIEKYTNKDINIEFSKLTPNGSKTTFKL
ncbi:MAG: hypothetical protein ACTSQP_19620 [Promethearchaeota archaeon]